MSSESISHGEPCEQPEGHNSHTSLSHADPPIPQNLLITPAPLASPQNSYQVNWHGGPRSAEHIEDINNGLSDYSVVRFQKSTETILGDDGQRVSPWQTGSRTEEDGVSKLDVQRRIRQLNQATKSVIDKKYSLCSVLRRQIDAELFRLIDSEPDIANFQWNLVQLDHQLRETDAPVRDRSRTIHSRPLEGSATRKAYERISVTAYFERSPRPGVDLRRLWEENRIALSLPHSGKVDLHVDSFPPLLSTLSPSQQFHAQASRGDQYKSSIRLALDSDESFYVDSDEYIEDQGDHGKGGYLEDKSADPSLMLVQRPHRESIKLGTSQHASKARTITTEQLSLPNSGFDSGYRSLSVTNESSSLVGQIGCLVDHEFLYSEAGSLEGRTDNYARYFADEIVTKLSKELKDVDWACFRTALSDLLREFAIRVANEGETQNHRDVMYWTHKWHEYVFSPIPCMLKGFAQLKF